MKKHQYVLKVLYDHRNVGDSYMRASEVARIVGRNRDVVLSNLNHHFLMRKVDRKKEKNRFYFRINEEGIKYLAYHNIISFEEANKAIEEMKQARWLLEDSSRRGRPEKPEFAT